MKTNQPFANIPGVHYPAPKPVRRHPLPAGCPPLVASYRLLAPWVAAAGLWPRTPSTRTIRRWATFGLIVFKKGATGVRMIDVPATLTALRPTD